MKLCLLIGIIEKKAKLNYEYNKYAYEENLMFHIAIILY